MTLIYHGAECVCVCVRACVCACVLACVCMCVRASGVHDVCVCLTYVGAKIWMP